MSNSEKKTKGRIAIVLGLIAISVIVYVAVSYQIEHNHRPSNMAQAPQRQVVKAVAPQNNASAKDKDGAPSLPTNAQLPSNIPPAMLKAMQDRGMSVDQLRGSGKGASTMNNKEFPDAMQKALAERNARAMPGTPDAKTAPAGMGMQSANTSTQFPAFVATGIKHIEAHQSKDQIALIDSYMDTLSKNPNDVDILIDASQLFLKHNDIQTATYFLQRATTAAPSNAEAAYLYGAALNKNFNSEETAQQWERSLGIQENPVVRYELALLYRYQLNQPELAKQYLEKALSFPKLDSTLKGNIQRELKR